MPDASHGTFHHVDLNVSDLAASRRIYALVLQFLGYTMVRDDERGCEWDIGPAEARCSLGLRAAAPALLGHAHQRYAPGLHHLAWCARSREDVDTLYRMLIAQGVPVLDPPAHYPQYSPTYYALFFEDPDGIKLELVHE